MAVMTAAGDVTLGGLNTDDVTFTWSGLTVTASRSRMSAENALSVLEPQGLGTMFQGQTFLSAWQRTAAEASSEALVFVIGERSGRPVFVLPMALCSRAGARLLTWAGQSHANYGMGHFESDLIQEFSRQDLDVDDLIISIARAVRADIVHLQNQPSTWAGHPNPFAASARVLRSANDTFVVALEDDFQRQYKRLFSNRTLSGLKRKQRKLEDTGKVSFARPLEPLHRRQSLDWFFETKTTQLAQSGRASPFAILHIQDLYQALAHDRERIDIDELTVDGKRIAMGLTAREGRTAYLLNSVHLGGDFARFSPGALLLHRMVAQAHAAGARTYDFGPGELPYKLEWEPDVVPLVFTTHLVNPLHVATYAMLVMGELAKAKAKRSPSISALVRDTRTLKARYFPGSSR